MHPGQVGSLIPSFYPARAQPCPTLGKGPGGYEVFTLGAYAGSDITGDGKLDLAALMGGGHPGDGLAVYFNQNGGAWPANSYPAAEINGSNGYIFKVTNPPPSPPATSTRAATAALSSAFPAIAATPEKPISSSARAAAYTWPHSGVLTSGDLTGGTTGVIIPGVNSGDKLGTAIAVGDLTGDGINDFAISAPYASPLRANGAAPPGWSTSSTANAGLAVHPRPQRAVSFLSWWVSCSPLRKADVEILVPVTETFARFDNDGIGHKIVIRPSGAAFHELRHVQDGLNCPPRTIHALDFAGQLIKKRFCLLRGDIAAVAHLHFIAELGHRPIRRSGIALMNDGM